MTQATLEEPPFHNSNLFTAYYLSERLRDRSEWDCDDEAREALDDLTDLYELEKDLLPGYKEDALIDSWIDEVLDILGYGTNVETTLPEGDGYVDVLLFEDTQTRRDAAGVYLDTKNTTDLFEGGLSLLEAKQWDADFTKRFSENRPYYNASQQISRYLDKTPSNIEWGILTNGRKWRLYGTKDNKEQTYYEVDLPELIEDGNLNRFKYFYLFFRPDAFRTTSGSTFLDSVWSESETAMQELGDDLQDNVFRALRVLGHGIVETNDLDIGPNDDEKLSELKEQSLVLLYRLMFVLYAESRQLINPEGKQAQKEYEENFSLDQHRLDIHDTIGEVDTGFEDEYSTYSTSIWNDLQDLFRLVDQGKESLGIPPYNGGLFDHDEHAFLTENMVSDRHLAEVIYRLSTTENDEGRYVLADYRDLDTRHLGSVYEGLLEHQFRIAPEDYAAVAKDGGQVWKPATEVTVADAVETVDQGSLYVTNDEGERKATGAYYTPDYVVNHIVEETIAPLIDDIREDLVDQGFETGTQEYLGAFLRRVTQLKILDPAMGSGHFLTGAMGYLAEQVMKEVREVEVEMGVAFNEQHVRREIAKECIYGVDINGMAVELAKLSMWLETLAADRPLAFLDHRLKAGNSLVGSDITDVLSEDSDDEDNTEEIVDEEPGFVQTSFSYFSQVRKDTLDHVMDLMKNLLAIDNEKLADIKSMEKLYDEIRDDPLYQRLFEVANVHSAQQFGLDVPEGVYEDMAMAIDDAEEWDKIQRVDWFESAQALADEQNFFHWELEYPEVFFDDDGEKLDGAGFDAVIGNPPYVSNWELTEADETLVSSLEKLYPEVTGGHWDLFIPFSFRAMTLTKPYGRQSFITPTSLGTEKYGTKLRKKFIEDWNIEKLTHFGEYQVFDQVDRQYLIYVASPTKKHNKKVDLIKYESPHFNHQTSVLQESFAEYSNYSIRPSLAKKDLNIKRNMDEQSIPLGRICCVNVGVVAHAGDHSELNFKKADVIHQDNKSDFKKYIQGSNISRYLIDWDGDWIDYDSKVDHFHRPKFSELFDSPKIVIPRVSGSGNRIESCYDDSQFYNNDNVSNVINWTPDIQELQTPKGFEPISDASEYDLMSIVGLLNSDLFTYYFSQFLATGTLQGSYTSIYPEDIRKMPMHSELKSDHDLKTNVSEIQKLKTRKSDLNLSILDHFGSYSDGPTLADIGLTQPPTGSADSILQQTAKEKPNLRVGESSVTRESDTTIEIRMTARYKPSEDDNLDEDNYKTDQWGYTETDPQPALRITDLTETEADLIESFVPVAVDEAGGFAGFRETATKTNSLVDRLRKLTLPALSDVEAGLESYTQTKERAEELEVKIERTDDLIDEIVYELYGLTDEEIEIVEEAVNG